MQSLLVITFICDYIVKCPTWEVRAIIWGINFKLTHRLHSKNSFVTLERDPYGGVSYKWGGVGSDVFTQGAHVRYDVI